MVATALFIPTHSIYLYCRLLLIVLVLQLQTTLVCVMRRVMCLRASYSVCVRAWDPSFVCCRPLIFSLSYSLSYPCTSDPLSTPHQTTAVLFREARCLACFASSHQDLYPVTLTYAMLAMRVAPSRLKVSSVASSFPFVFGWPNWIQLGATSNS